MTVTTTAPVKLKSRAVLRQIDPGNDVDCAHCDTLLKYRAQRRQHQVICNVYKHGRWDRVEHFHEDCYTAAGQPHGAVLP